MDKGTLARAFFIGSLSLGLLVLPLGGAIWLAAAKADEAPLVLPAPAVDDRSNAITETAVLAGGCFWGVQGVFEHVKGVTKVLSGYAGGAKSTAEYENVRSAPCLVRRNSPTLFLGRA